MQARVYRSSKLTAATWFALAIIQALAGVAVMWHATIWCERAIGIATLAAAGFSACVSIFELVFHAD